MQPLMYCIAGLLNKYSQAFHFSLKMERLNIEKLPVKEGFISAALVFPKTLKQNTC